MFHAELPEIAEGTKAERVKDTYTFYKAYDIDLNDYHSGYALMYLDSSGLGGGGVDDMGKLNEGTLTVSIGIEGETRTATINVPEYSTLKYVEEQLTYAFHQWGVTAHVLHRNRANLPTRISAHKDPREIKCAIAFLSADKPTYWMGGRWDSTHNTLCYLDVTGGTVHGMPMLPDKLPLTTLETGFSVSDDYMTVNAETEEKDPDSILSWYRALADLRSAHDVLTAGSYEEILNDSEQIYGFIRKTDDTEAVILANFSEEEAEYDAALVDGAELLISSAGADSRPGLLRPLECVIFENKN